MRAKPILSLTLLAAALALPGTAASLGLGKLTVESALGQPLSAQIELTSVAKEELDSLTARIADPSLYRQNNSPTRACCRARASRSSAAQRRRRISRSRRRRSVERAVSRPAGRGQLGVRPRRARLHVPARSAGHAAPLPAIEPVTPPRAGDRRRARAAAAGTGAPARGRSAAPAAARPAAATRSSAATRCRRSPSEYKPPGVTLEQMLVALFKSNQARSTATT